MDRSWQSHVSHSPDENPSVKQNPRPAVELWMQGLKMGQMGAAVVFSSYTMKKPEGL